MTISYKPLNIEDLFGCPGSRLDKDTLSQTVVYPRELRATGESAKILSVSLENEEVVFTAETGIAEEMLCRGIILTTQATPHIEAEMLTDSSLFYDDWWQTSPLQAIVLNVDKLKVNTIATVQPYNQKSLRNALINKVPRDISDILNVAPIPLWLLAICYASKSLRMSLSSTFSISKRYNYKSDTVIKLGTICEYAWGNLSKFGQFDKPILEDNNLDNSLYMSWRSAMTEFGFNLSPEFCFRLRSAGSVVFDDNEILRQSHNGDCVPGKSASWFFAETVRQIAPKNQAVVADYFRNNLKYSDGLAYSINLINYDKLSTTEDTLDVLEAMLTIKDISNGDGWYKKLTKVFFKYVGRYFKATGSLGDAALATKYIGIIKQLLKDVPYEINDDAEYVAILFVNVPKERDYLYSQVDRMSNPCRNTFFNNLFLKAQNHLSKKGGDAFELISDYINGESEGVEVIRKLSKNTINKCEIDKLVNERLERYYSDLDIFSRIKLYGRVKKREKAIIVDSLKHMPADELIEYFTFGNRYQIELFLSTTGITPFQLMSLDIPDNAKEWCLQQI